MADTATGVRSRRPARATFVDGGRDEEHEFNPQASDLGLLV